MSIGEHQQWRVDHCNRIAGHFQDSCFSTIWNLGFLDLEAPEIEFRPQIEYPVYCERLLLASSNKL